MIASPASRFRFDRQDDRLGGHNQFVHAPACTLSNSSILTREPSCNGEPAGSVTVSQWAGFGSGVLQTHGVSHRCLR